MSRLFPIHKASWWHDYRKWVRIYFFLIHGFFLTYVMSYWKECECHFTSQSLSSHSISVCEQLAFPPGCPYLIWNSMINSLWVTALLSMKQPQSEIGSKWYCITARLYMYSLNTPHLMTNRKWINHSCIFQAGLILIWFQIGCESYTELFAYKVVWVSLSHYLLVCEYL